MKRLFLLLLSFLILTGCSQIQSSSPSSTPTLHANCILKGILNVTNDLSGDIKFLGEIQNTGNRRSNYTKITFTLRASNEAILEVPYTYVDTTFGDIEISSSETFTCWSNTNSNEVSSYSYKITWSEY
jgi:hypothetical protein